MEQFNPGAYITENQFVILDTTNASATSASLVVKGGFTTKDTFVDGHVMINNVKITPNLDDIVYEKELVLENNINEWTEISGFEFDSSITSSFKAYINITVSATHSKFASMDITGLYKPTGWIMISSFTGDLTGVTFDITNVGDIGKIRYKNSNTNGTSTIRYRANTNAQPGTTPLSHVSGIIENNTGPFIPDRLIYSNTINTLASTDIIYNMNVLKIGGASRLVLENGSGFTNFSNGGALSSMGDISVVGNAIISGNIGINTTSPTEKIDINGKMQISDSIKFNNNKILLSGSIGIDTTSNYANSIVINASPEMLISNTEGTFNVSPVRNAQANNVLNYNTVTKEIVYKPYCYGQFFSTSTQELTADSSVAIVHQSTGEINGINVTGSPQTKITFSQIGKYKIGTSILFSESGGSATSVRFWFKKGGTNIQESGSVVYVPGNNTLTLAYAEIIVDISNITNDYIEIFAYTTSDNISVTYSSSTVDYPGSPGIITTVYQLN